MKEQRARGMAAVRNVQAQFGGIPLAPNFAMPHVSKALDVGLGIASPAYAALKLDSTGSVIPLNLIRAGSGFNNRVGRAINLKSMQLQLSLQHLATSALSGDDYARILVIWDDSTNGALPAMADILADVDQAGTPSTGPMSGLNLNNRTRFSIIADKRVHIPQITITAGIVALSFPGGAAFEGESNDCAEVTLFRKLGKYTTNYKADSSPAVIGDIAQGGLYLVSLAGNTAAVSNMTCDWKCRLKYTD